MRTDEQIKKLSNDSIMELLCCKLANSEISDLSQSLNVVPLSFSNVARFFNGINNNEKGSKSVKQNLRSMRCQVKGKATVLLYTKRAVKKGEPLLFDYNEAGKNWYPTNDFV